MNSISISKITDKSIIPYNLLLQADPSIDSIKEYVHSGFIYGAYINGTIIGIYILLKTRPFTLELMNISIDESYQGKGIGKQLIFNAIEEARRLKAKTLEVGTGNSSINQLALYQKCGFKINCIDKGYFKKYYEEPIYENGIQCTDMIRLSMDL